MNYEIARRCQPIEVAQFKSDIEAQFQGMEATHGQSKTPIQWQEKPVDGAILVIGIRAFPDSDTTE